ncbi:MAG: quinoprotein dehydrogenase-associated putative ABC transporter substrate-binding protein [Burkholderiales bacterium]|nr:quinoprotein dehydrogenase-associated putative ABC transporter substrate-binding protein [Burkholderiales bacterium]
MRSLLPAILAVLAGAACAQDKPGALRVCADPDNLPFSHQDETGFENRIASLLAAEMGLPLQYEWMPDRRAFVRKTLGAQLCDVIIGVPVEFERVMPTRPYYRSTYVFVEREPAPGQQPLVSFDDPRIRQHRIGLQLIGNDLLASPPGYALTRRGAIDNVVGVTLAGDTPPAARLLKSVARGELDAALLWGPQAGYYAQRSPVPLRVSVAQHPADLPLPFEFSIAMGVRRGATALQQQLNEIIGRRGADIRAILADYGVPLLEEPGS